MTDQDSPDQNGTGEDPETGEPISALRGFGEAPSTGFLDRIRGSIQRRLLTSQIAEISWFAPVLVAMEFVKFFFGFFQSLSGRRSDNG